MSFIELLCLWNQIVASSSGQVALFTGSSLNPLTKTVVATSTIVNRNINLTQAGSKIAVPDGKGGENLAGIASRVGAGQNYVSALTNQIILNPENGVIEFKGADSALG